VTLPKRRIGRYKGADDPFRHVTERYSIDPGTKAAARPGHRVVTGNSSDCSTSRQGADSDAARQPAPLALGAPR
jgi:hypothetical protein